MTLSEGTLIRDRYRVERLIARGGMASVYQVSDSRSDCAPRALKHYHAEVAQRHRGIAAREGRLLQGLKHDSLPTAHDFFSEGGEEYVVLDYFPGASLYDAAIKWNERPLPAERVLAWAEMLLNVLGYLHGREQPVVHRDINPTNLVFVGGGERVALIDFSIAARASIDGRQEAGELIEGGTPPYAPPEQWAGGGVDPRADLYAAGATIYHLLTTIAPPDLYKTHVLKTEPPQPLQPAHVLNPSVPRAVSDMLTRAMAYDPEERPASAEEMRGVIAEELSRLLTSQPASACESLASQAAWSPPAGASEVDAGAAARPHETFQSPPPEPPQVYDEDVAFTVFSPSVVAPDKWYEMLAFAHLAGRRPDAPADEPDPVEEVRRQASRVLGEQMADYREKSEESSGSVPRAGELIFKPYIEGFEFNPESRVVRWEESVHREEFKLRAARRLDGREAKGHLRVYLGPLILAQITLKVSVDSRAAALTKPTPASSETARPLRRVFASYSHRDRDIVERIEHSVSRAHLGVEYLRDATRLRAGEVWDDELMRMIDRADMFQLFWSRNSMASPFVRREIEYALRLARRRPYFILPVYWETPFPERPEEDLPPGELRSLHFENISEFELATHPSAPPDAMPGSRQVAPPPPAADVPRPITVPTPARAGAPWDAPTVGGAGLSGAPGSRSIRICPTCRSAAPPSARFCGRCGMPIGGADPYGAAAAPTPAASPSPQSPRTLETATRQQSTATISMPPHGSAVDASLPRTRESHPHAAPRSGGGGVKRLARAASVALMLIPTGLAALMLFVGVSMQASSSQRGGFDPTPWLVGCGALALLGLTLFVLLRRR
jgi:serine/threonine protein kinase